MGLPNNKNVFANGLSMERAITLWLGPHRHRDDRDVRISQPDYGATQEKKISEREKEEIESVSFQSLGGAPAEKPPRRKERGKLPRPRSSSVNIVDQGPTNAHYQAACQRETPYFQGTEVLRKGGGEGRTKMREKEREKERRERRKERVNYKGRA
jgi:hypothetical protein